MQTVAEVQAEIANAKALLAAINAAILALVDPTVSSYTLDTAQSRQVVRREDLPKLYEQRRALQDEIVTLDARISNSGVVQGVPSW